GAWGAAFGSRDPAGAGAAPRPVQAAEAGPVRRRIAAQRHGQGAEGAAARAPRRPLRALTLVALASLRGRCRARRAVRGGATPAHCRHSGAGRNPALMHQFAYTLHWTPAFAGVTAEVCTVRSRVCGAPLRWRPRAP